MEAATKTGDCPMRMTTTRARVRTVDSPAVRMEVKAMPRIETYPRMTAKTTMETKAKTVRVCLPALLCALLNLIPIYLLPTIEEAGSEVWGQIARA